MNIFHKVTLQSMKKSRTRTMVTVLGVILSSAMITAVAAFAVSLQQYMVKGAIQKYGGWHVEFLDVSSSYAEERESDEGVINTAAFQNIGYAVLEGGENPAKPYLFITGFNREAFENLPVTLISGRLPENSGEVLIPAHVAANGGVKYSVGDELTLSVGDRIGADGKLGQHDPYAFGNESGQAGETLVPRDERTYKVAGIFERPSFEEFSAPGYTLITTQEQPGRADSYSVFVTLKNPRKVHAYAENTTGSHAYVFNDEVLRFMGLSDDTIFNALLYSVGGVLVVLIMTGSVFLIYNSFYISLNERTRQFGILSSVGATAKQLRNSVLFEGLIIGAAGIPIGVITGILSIRLVISVIAGNFGSILYSSVPLTLKVSAPAIGAAFLVSMVTILISAYIPAQKAASTPVMESIRQTNEVKVEVKAVKTSKLSERIYGLEGTLALKNFRRNKRRYKSIVLSLTFSMVLFVAASAFGSHLKQAADQAVVKSDYDICFYTEDMEEGELFALYEQLKTAPGIYESSYQAISSFSCEVKAGVLSKEYREEASLSQPDETVKLSVDIQFLEDSVFLSFLESLGLPPEEYTGQNPKIIAAAKAKRTDNNGKRVLVNMFESPNMDFWITPETNDSAAGQEQDISITFVDTIPVDTLPRNPSQVRPYVFMVVAPYQLKEKYVTLMWS